MSAFDLSVTAIAISLIVALFTGWQAASSHQAARVDKARRHDEMAPEFDVAIQRDAGEETGRLVLCLTSRHPLARIEVQFADQDSERGVFFSHGQSPEGFWQFPPGSKQGKIAFYPVSSYQPAVLQPGVPISWPLGIFRHSMHTLRLSVRCEDRRGREWVVPVIVVVPE